MFIPRAPRKLDCRVKKAPTFCWTYKHEPDALSRLCLSFNGTLNRQQKPFRYRMKQHLNGTEQSNSDAIYEWVLGQELHHPWRMEFTMMSLGKWTKTKMRLLLGSSVGKAVHYDIHHFWMNYQKKNQFPLGAHRPMGSWLGEQWLGCISAPIITSAEPTWAVHNLYNCAQESWGVRRELPEIRCNENFVSLFRGLKVTVFRSNPFPRPFPLFLFLGGWLLI